jgi:hypothetical protein
VFPLRYELNIYIICTMPRFQYRSYTNKKAALSGWSLLGRRGVPCEVGTVYLYVVIVRVRFQSREFETVKYIHGFCGNGPENECAGEAQQQL